MEISYYKSVYVVRLASLSSYFLSRYFDHAMLYGSPDGKVVPAALPT